MTNITNTNPLYAWIVNKETSAGQHVTLSWRYNSGLRSSYGNLGQLLWNNGFVLIFGVVVVYYGQGDIEHGIMD